MVGYQAMKSIKVSMPHPLVQTQSFWKLNPINNIKLEKSKASLIWKAVEIITRMVNGWVFKEMIYRPQCPLIKLLPWIPLLSALNNPIMNISTRQNTLKFGGERIP